MKQKILNLKPSVFIAVGLAILAIAWILSGQLKFDDAVVTNSKDDIATDKTKTLITVRVIKSIAKDHNAVIIINGKTETSMNVEINAETDGRIFKINMNTGQVINKGDVIAKIMVNNRQAVLNHAKNITTQRKLEYEAAKKLALKGFQSKIKKAAALANLSAAKANLLTAQIDLNHTVIKSPFDGIISKKHTNIGDYVKSGDPIANIISLNPLYVTAHVAEGEIDHIKTGAIISIRLITGQQTTGKITRIAPVADDNTRTFKIEAMVDNQNNFIKAGLSAELRLSLATEKAHLITPAILSLNDDGNVGIKTITKDNIVIFNQIKIIENTDEGLWITGIDNKATIISVGQEYVVHGQKVNTVIDSDIKKQADGLEAIRNVKT